MALARLAHRAAESGPPLTPEGDDARRWAEEELAKPEYAAAEPTLFDRVARAIGDFLRDLLSAQLPDGAGQAFALVAAIVVTVLIVAAILVWGVPRAAPRSRAAHADIFGDADVRTAAQLRRDAASHAAKQEWDAAIVLRFRALARGLAERGVVETPPGATVHAFARAAALPFPGAADELEAAAAAFDDVRYLRRPGTAELYRRVAAVDDAVTAAQPREAAPA